MSKSKVLVRNATQDGMMGLIVGLLVAVGLVSANLDVQQGLFASHAPLSSLATTVAAVAMQCALVASTCGMLIRKFSDTGR